MADDDDHAMSAPGDEATSPASPTATADDSTAAAEAEAEAAGPDSSSTSTVAGDDEDGDDDGGGQTEAKQDTTDDGSGKTEDNRDTTNSGEAAVPTADADADAPPPAKRRAALCDVCHGAPAKYKCPRCPQAYCSVVCARTHKENHPPEEATGTTTTSSAAAPAPAPQPTPSSADRHPFGVLDNAPELQRLFAQYPGLPARLRAIYEATQPPAAGADVPHSGGGRGRGRGRGGGGGFRGGGGRGGFSSSSSQPWTKEQGLRQGQRALRQARVDPGDDGDGVRAYCELVLHLLGRAEARGGGGAAAATVPTAAAAAATTTDADAAADATALVRQEVARADAELVEQLLRADQAAGGLR